VKLETTLVLPVWLADEIAQAARDKVEGAGVLIAGVARSAAGLKLLGRELHWVPEGAYTRRTAVSMTILSGGYVPALQRAEALGAAAVWFHTHPGRDADPVRSDHDHRVDDDLADTFRIRLDTDVYASVVAAPASMNFRFTGMAIDKDRTCSIDRVLVVGDRWTLLAAEDSLAGDEIPTMFDRQVRAFGGDIQRVISRLRIGIVGCGGTGSAVAEQLARSIPNSYPTATSPAFTAPRRRTWVSPRRRCSRLMFSASLPAPWSIPWSAPSPTRGWRAG
jgi:hypothetical protein